MSASHDGGSRWRNLYGCGSWKRANTDFGFKSCDICNTTTALALGGGPANAGELSMPSDCLWGFRVMVVGRQENANTNCAWEITGLATNDAGTAAIVGTPTVTALNTVPVGWGSPTVSVTGSSTRLFFNVTGAIATSIRWVARAEITQVIS